MAEGDPLLRKGEATLAAAEAMLIRNQALEKDIAAGLTTEEEIRKRTRSAAARGTITPSKGSTEETIKNTGALKANTAAALENQDAIRSRVSALESEQAASARILAQRRAESDELRKQTALQRAAASQQRRVAAASTPSSRIAALAGGGLGYAGSVGAARDPFQAQAVQQFRQSYTSSNPLGALRGLSTQVGRIASVQEVAQRLQRLNRVASLLEGTGGSYYPPGGVGPPTSVPPYALPPSRAALPAAGQTGYGRGGPPGAPPGIRPGDPGLYPGYAQRVTEAQVATRLLRTDLSQLAVATDASGQAMRKHGALTSEFIQAATRGEVTIRELGYQTTATVGKFGGWLGAGAAVYGVLGAVTALGRGAIDSYSGVNQLSRVITEDLDATKARESFRALADEFNLPIADVADAAYQMGKVFHDQNSAFEAARSVLYSVKVGELDVATATRYLTAITNGFNLEAEHMPLVFDQINQAQNRFGITIGDVEAGIAKAAGTFNQAAAPGGAMQKYHTLLALVTTAQKATGVTGEVAGTAIARAPNFLRQASNQQALRDFGINAGAGIDKVIEQAFKVSHKLGGEELQQLAAAIFGPQYGARIGTPLLSQEDLYRQVLRETAPGQAKGSAQTELERQLGSVEEQVKAIGIGLQELGGALADAGAFDSIGVLIKLINEGLDSTLLLVETFNSLPDGLQKAVSWGTQLLLLLRLMRRLQLGEFIAGGPRAEPTGLRGAAANFFGEGERGTARRIRAGFTAEQRYLEDQRAGASSRAAQAGLEAEAAAARHEAITRENELRARNSGLLESEYDKTQESIRGRVREEAARNRMVSAEERAMVAESEKAVATERLTQVDKNLAQSRRFGGRLDVPGTLAAAEQDARAHAVDTFGRPTLEPVVQSQTLLADEQKKLAVDAEKAAADAEKKASDAAKASEAAALRTQDTEKATTRFGKALNGVLNNFGQVLFGIFAISLVAEQINSIAASIEDEIENSQITGATAKARAESASHLAGLSRGASVQDVIADFFTGSGTAGTISRAFLGPFGGKPTESITDIRNSIRDQEAANYQLQLQQQEEARAEGRAVPFRSLGDIEKNIKAVGEGRKGTERAGKLLRQYKEELRYSLEQLGQGDGSTKEQQAAVDEAEQNLRRVRADLSATKGLAHKVGSLTADELIARIEAEVSLAAGPGGEKTKADHLRRARTYFREVLRDVGDSNAPEDLATLSAARDAFYSAILENAQSELDAALNLTSDPTERLDAYSTAIDQARSGIQDSRRDVQRARRRTRQLQSQVDAANLQKQIAQAYGNLDKGAPTEDLGDPIRFPTAGLQFQDAFGNFDPKTANNAKRIARKAAEDAHELRQKLAGQQGVRDGLIEDLKKAEDEYEQFVQESRRARYDEITSRRGARLDLRLARTADPIRQARITLDHLGRDIELAVAAYEKGLISITDVIALRQQRIEQRAQLAQAQVALIEARGRLGISTITDDTAHAQGEIQTMRDTLAYMQSHPNQFDPAEIINLQAQINEQVADLAEQQKEDALALAQARLGIAQARAEAAGNEVRAAIIGIRQANLERKAADTPLERLEAIQGQIEAKAAKRDAVYQNQVEDIEFQASIGKLTLDEQIRQYQRLLDTAKLNRDMRRDLREKIYGLKQQAEEETGGFDLTVGNIKLPTVYEIRRAMQGGVNPKQGGVNVNQDNKVAIHVHDSAQAGKVAEQLDKALGGSAANALRSAGL